MSPANAMTSSDESQGQIHCSGISGVEMDSASYADHDLHRNTRANMSMPSKNYISSSKNLAYEISRDRILIKDGMAVVNSVIKN